MAPIKTDCAGEGFGEEDFGDPGDGEWPNPVSMQDPSMSLPYGLVPISYNICLNIPQMEYEKENTSISGVVEPSLEAMETSKWETRDLEWDQDWVVTCFWFGVDLLQGFKSEAG